RLVIADWATRATKPHRLAPAAGSLPLARAVSRLREGSLARAHRLDVLSSQQEEQEGSGGGHDDRASEERDVESVDQRLGLIRTLRSVAEIGERARRPAR